MSRLKPTPEIKAMMVQKEILLYQAVHSAAAFILPCLMVLGGLLISTPFFWDFVPESAYENEIYKYAHDLLLRKYVSWVIVAFGFAAIIRTQRRGKKFLHFITNLRVVEREKRLMGEDIQYVLLHRVKFVKVKRTLFEFLSHSGKIIIEDDHHLEHIEMDEISHPEEFKRALKIAQDRFAETAKVAEDTGVIKQVQSDKMKRQIKERERKEERKRRDAERQKQKKAQWEEEKKRLEEEERIRKQNETGY